MTVLGVYYPENEDDFFTWEKKKKHKLAWGKQIDEDVLAFAFPTNTTATDA